MMDELRDTMRFLRDLEAGLRGNTDGEHPPCDDCGAEVWYNAWVEDDVWEAIRPEPGPPGGGGTLCVRCIDRRCVEAGLEDVVVRWHWTGEAAKCHSPEEKDAELLDIAIQTFRGMPERFWADLDAPEDERIYGQDIADALERLRGASPEEQDSSVFGHKECARCHQGFRADLRDVYRCVECSLPFHLSCAKMHFRDTSHDSPEEPSWEENVGREYTANLLDSIADDRPAMERDFLKDLADAIRNRLVPEYMHSPEEPMAWRPIETAPKDGTPIRIYADGLRDEDFNPSGSVEGFWSDDQGWLGSVWNPQHDFWMALPMSPTHWMPLPEPPIGQALDSEEGS